MEKLGEKGSKKASGPWPDAPAARLFLAGLVHGPEAGAAYPFCYGGSPVQESANWLIEAEIAGLALRQYGQRWPELAQALQQDQYVAVAEWGLHTETLVQLSEVLQKAGIKAVLLKGAALALTVYPQRAWRTMSDIDVWVQAEEMPAAVRAIERLGFDVYGKEERPLPLQQLAQGEIQLYRTEWKQGLIELHWSPFPGWWLRRVAQTNADAVWERKEVLPSRAKEADFYQLAAEDMVIQVSLHQVAGGQFGSKPIQALIDITLTATYRSVDWRVVANRAQQWRIATAVYTVLDLVDQLIGCDGIEAALAPLRPSHIRRWLISHFVSPESVLNGQDVRSGRARFLLLLLLVDRPRDMLVLIFRTLWPEDEWIQARYRDQPVSRWQHIWQILRYGQI